MAASDAFYIEIREEVDGVLAELGTEYSVRGPGQYDPSTLKRGKEAARTVVGLVADQKVAHSLGSMAFPITETSAFWKASKSLILKADSDPKPEEEVFVDGQWHSLSMARPIKPADVVVVYMLDLSR